MLLYETLSQPKIALILLVCGFFCGFFFDLDNYIVFLCNKNKILRVFLDVFFACLSCFVMYVLILNLNYGEIRFYEILTFSSGIFIERKTLGLIIAKISKWCYTKFENLMNKLKEKHKKKNDTRESKTST